MKLLLKWKGISNNIYNLGILSKNSEKYVFEINEYELKKAILDGCMGIGSFDLMKNKVESNDLFEFFNSRIVSQESWKLPDLLKEYGLKKYDKMKILKATQARSVNDRYWVEEI